MPEDTAGTGTPAAPPVGLTPPERAAVVERVEKASKSFKSKDDWNGIPLFKCPYCPHALAIRDGKGDGEGAIELHILSKIDAGDARHLAALDKK